MQVTVGPAYTLECFPRFEFIDEYAHRDARFAAIAIRCVSDILTAAKTTFKKIVDENAGPSMGQVRKQLALLPAGQIWAWLCRGNVKLRKIGLMFAQIGSMIWMIAPRAKSDAITCRNRTVRTMSRQSR